MKGALIGLVARELDWARPLCELSRLEILHRR